MDHCNVVLGKRYVLNYNFVQDIQIQAAIVGHDSDVADHSRLIYKRPPGGTTQGWQGAFTFVNTLRKPVWILLRYHYFREGVVAF